jgi:hypothetical protein
MTKETAKEDEHGAEDINQEIRIGGYDSIKDEGKDKLGGKDIKRRLER